MSLGVENRGEFDEIGPLCSSEVETRNSSNSSVGSSSTQYCTNDDRSMSSGDMDQTSQDETHQGFQMNLENSFIETENNDISKSTANLNFPNENHSIADHDPSNGDFTAPVLKSIRMTNRNQIKSQNHGERIDLQEHYQDPFRAVSVVSTPVTRRRIPTYINQKSRQAREVLNRKSNQAKAAIRNTPQRIRNSVKQYRAKKRQKSKIIVIPCNHRLKIAWDFLTVLLTFVSAYIGHIYIRDRSTYDYDWWVVFTNTWFFIDILLNFFTDHRTSDGQLLSRGREVWGRYLTTWFVIDALSLLPWERMFLRPIIQMQNRRNIVIKWFFRSKAVIKVTRILRGRHLKAFAMVSKRTKSVGVGGHKLLQLIIKYVPKYLLFYRNMKCVIILKTLRQIHFVKKITRNLRSEPPVNEDDTSVYSLEDYDSSFDIRDDENYLATSRDEDDAQSFSSDMTVVLDEIETEYETSYDCYESENESIDSYHHMPNIQRVSSEPHIHRSNIIGRLVM